MFSRFNKRSNNRVKNNLLSKYKVLAICIGIFIVIVTILLIALCHNNMHQENTKSSTVIYSSDKKLETDFEISEITFYSSANATNSKTLSYGLDISQYTDISFYIKNPGNKVIKSLQISDIFFDPYPKIGNPALAYKNPFDFGKLTNYDLQYDDEINFDIVNEETDNFEKPIMYDNLSTPVSLTYLNSGVKENFVIKQSGTTIQYDGSLLKSANVDVDQLLCSVNFKVKIIDISDKEYESDVSFEIPYTSEEKSILGGSILTTLPVKGTFYSY